MARPRASVGTPAVGERRCTSVPSSEWPPETTTCGRMLTHPGPCRECSKTRTRLRKAERRQGKEGEAAAGQNGAEAFELVLPAF